MPTISIVAGGTRGDVQPYIALGSGLRAAGYAVRVISSDDFEALVTDAGLAFASTGFSVADRLQSEEWRNATERGNALAILWRMRGEMQRAAAGIAQRMPDALRGSDLIVAGMAGLSGAFSIAEALKIPVIQAYVVPFTPTRAFAAPLLPGLPFGGALNRLSFMAMRQLLWQSGKLVDVTIRQALGLPRQSFWGPWKALERGAAPVMYGYSRHVLPRPGDWPEHHQLTGYWFLDAASDWTPPAGLQAFLDAGTPPVYIGFGSMGSRDPRALAQLALQALARTGQRGLLASGWGGLSVAELPATVYHVESVPHSWLFPRVVAVVHHGGAGTTAAGLRAGVPSIIVPFGVDQPFWGRRVAALGVGPAPIPRNKLSADNLAAAINHSISTTALRREAEALGAMLRAEDGIGAAVAIVERVIGPAVARGNGHEQLAASFGAGSEQ